MNPALAERLRAAAHNEMSTADLYDLLMEAAEELDPTDRGPTTQELEARRIEREEEETLRFLKQFQRDDLQRIVEILCQMQTFPNESSHTWRHVILRCVNDGTTSIEEIKAAFNLP